MGPAIKIIIFGKLFYPSTCISVSLTCPAGNAGGGTLGVIILITVLLQYFVFYEISHYFYLKEFVCVGSKKNFLIRYYLNNQP